MLPLTVNPLVIGGGVRSHASGVIYEERSEEAAWGAERRCPAGRDRALAD
jgi:hypothetical protein